MTLPDWILEIEKRTAEATPGPWNAVNQYSDYYYLESPDEILINEKGINGHEDARFITHSRADIPRLIDSLKISIEALERIVDIEDTTSASANDSRYYPTLCAAKQALAKIRGES